jgi:hypothetical protein
MGIYDRLGFNTTDSLSNSAVQAYSANVNIQMNSMPQLLNSWQTADVANSNVGGYFVNPVFTVANNILSTANTLYYTANGVSGSNQSITLSLANTRSAAYQLANTTVNNYIYLTNRQSNVVDIGMDTTTPHYKLAVGVGTMMCYLAYQSDGVQNNSPMIGNFTSIFLGNTLNSLYATMNVMTNQLANSITITQQGLSSYSNTTNITLQFAQTLENTVVTIQNTMNTHIHADTAFYNNSRSVLTDFTTVRQFTGMGQTQSDLINNHIGSPKLLSRLNS